MKRFLSPRASAAALLALLLPGAAGSSAARNCGAAASYRWSVRDFRYDGGATAEAESTVSVVLSPSTNLHSCLGSWPEASGGRVDGRLIWNDCIWTGPGETQEYTVSFAVDWKTKTGYVAHTYTCSDAARRGQTLVATGSTPIEVECEGSSCFSKAERINLETKQEDSALAAGAACADNRKRSQSWVVENYARTFSRADSRQPITADSGPAFTLRNLANGDVFNCTSTAGPGAGKCVGGGSSSSTTAKFHFDTQRDHLTVSQHWTCAEGAFDATGITYVQRLCERSGSSYNCAMEPFWIGGEVGSSS